jgi:hypothetical protein
VLEELGEALATALVLACPASLRVGLLAGVAAMRRRDLICGLTGLVICALESLLLGIAVCRYCLGAWRWW